MEEDTRTGRMRLARHLAPTPSGLDLVVIVSSAEQSQAKVHKRHEANCASGHLFSTIPGPSSVTWRYANTVRMRLSSAANHVPAAICDQNAVLPDSPYFPDNMHAVSLECSTVDSPRLPVSSLQIQGMQLTICQGAYGVHIATPQSGPAPYHGRKYFSVSQDRALFLSSLL